MPRRLPLPCPALMPLRTLCVCARGALLTAHARLALARRPTMGEECDYEAMQDEIMAEVDARTGRC